MASYPSAVKTFRALVDRAGIIYNSIKTNTLFAKDINDLSAEVVAVETDLIAKIDQAVKTTSSPSFIAATLARLDVATAGAGFTADIHDFELNVGDPETDPLVLPLPTMSPQASLLGKFLAVRGGLAIITEDGAGNNLALVALNTTTHDFIAVNFGINPLDGSAYMDGTLKLLSDGTYFHIDAGAYYASGTPPVADGTYQVGARVNATSENGTITVKGGIITAIQEATGPTYDTGALYPAVVENSETPGGGAPVWQDVNNVKVADEVFATLATSGLTPKSLISSSFGWTLPESARVVGIKVEIRVKTETANQNAQVVITSVDDESTEFGYKNIELTTSEQTIVLGSDSDLWAGSWNPAHLNSLFKVNLDVAFGDVGDVSVDFVRTTIYYT